MRIPERAGVVEVARRLGLADPDESWPDYLARFHEERPGVIQAVLEDCRAGSRDPYDWLARSVSRSARVVVDVCCGAGALTRRLAMPGRQVVGVEALDAELALARSRAGEGVRVVRGTPTALPMGDGQVDAVVTSMGMVTTRDPRALAAEAARVLRPGGVFAAMAPTVRPVRRAMVGPALEVARRVGSVPSFPGALEMRMRALLADAGLRMVEDARSCYGYTVVDEEAASRVIGALYLPGSTPRGRRSAVAWLARRAASGQPVTLPVPMRRIVAVKSPGA
ncbi:class I SAM-dependent methyltransferase [Acidipropionibacterium timonense]|uniref:class I SAM-dependent methyltransferase n=1 Tax=Acidipropionibacterium timonense TaxID=2161818 RepID=UPI00143674AA|nr:class I SAM-dependent methyltransferase [Acidipropionibacterium timonense]